MKKILLGIGTIAAIASPVVASVSCGTKGKTTNEWKDVGSLQPSSHTVQLDQSKIEEFLRAYDFKKPSDNNFDQDNLIREIKYKLYFESHKNTIAIDDNISSAFAEEAKAYFEANKDNIWFREYTSDTSWDGYVVIKDGELIERNIGLTRRGNEKDFEWNDTESFWNTMDIYSLFSTDRNSIDEDSQIIDMYQDWFTIDYVLSFIETIPSDKHFETHWYASQYDRNYLDEYYRNLIATSMGFCYVFPKSPIWADNFNFGQSEFYSNDRVMQAIEHNDFNVRSRNSNLKDGEFLVYKEAFDYGGKHYDSNFYEATWDKNGYGLKVKDPNIQAYIDSVVNKYFKDPNTLETTLKTGVSRLLDALIYQASNK